LTLTERIQSKDQVSMMSVKAKPSPERLEGVEGQLTNGKLSIVTTTRERAPILGHAQIVDVVLCDRQGSLDGLVERSKEGSRKKTEVMDLETREKYSHGQVLANPKWIGIPLCHKRSRQPPNPPGLRLGHPFRLKARRRSLRLHLEGSRWRREVCRRRGHGDGGSGPL
jgi:hypothetical protein